MAWQLLAQIPDTTVLTYPEPQFFVALVAGLALALAFQLLLTNLSVATGISLLGNVNPSSMDSSEGESLGGAFRKIGVAVGLWTLVTVSLALFVASFLAVKLSLTTDVVLGAILGLVIWAAYFSLLVWGGSNTVGSLVGSLVNTVNAGFQGLVGTAAAAFGGKSVNDQVVATAEAAAAAMRREFGGDDHTTVREMVEDYLGDIRRPEMDLPRIRREFEKLFNDPELQSLASRERLANVDRKTFVDLVSSRTDLSRKEVDRLTDQLQDVWEEMVQKRQQRDLNEELLTFLRSARPEELRGTDLNNRLGDLVEQLRQERATQPQAAKDAAKPSLMDQALQYGYSTLLGTVLGRTDLSDLDVQKVLQQLQGLRDKATDQVSNLANTIRTDSENYLRNSYPWKFNNETIAQEFREVLLDPEADPAQVRRQVSGLDRAFFEQTLKARGDFAEARMQEIIDQLLQIQTEVLTQLQSAEAQAHQGDLKARLETVLTKTPKEQLGTEANLDDFRQTLDDPTTTYPVLQERLGSFDTAYFTQGLQQRGDLDGFTLNALVAQLDQAKAQVLDVAQQRPAKPVDQTQQLVSGRVSQAVGGTVDQAKGQADQTLTMIADYLRNTQREELNPEGIQRDLNTLLQNPKQGLRQLRDRLSQLDRDTLLSLVNQRQDLNREQADQLVDQVQGVLGKVSRSPRRFASRAQATVMDFESNLEGYLRNTQKEELNPEGIKRDLSILVRNPQQGLSNLGERLSQVDRSTVVALLSQRQDISESEANRILDQFDTARTQVIDQLQQVQRRLQQSVEGLFSRLRVYLNALDRPELNYESIKRDLRRTLDDPKAGFEGLRDRLGQFNRETVVALLSSRDDISTHDANRILAQLENARDSVLQRAERVQSEAQKRMEDLKRQAQKQADETRKTAAAASWWLLGTALTSAAFAALGGFLAVLP
ncbi:hypothetical protein [Candidatus Cyanaurora vandensis]|uniref:hypothetical protein n=1 Tax=Candidatus Cyanaurora vandensis TaxID=2714958 RepID=UPI00257D53E0|nr:hypothetical protein [Candidatus Cyanaurora vandensis]